MFRTCQYLRIVFAFKPTPERNRDRPARTVLPRTPRDTRDFLGGFLLPWGEGESRAEAVDGRKGRGRKPIGVSSVPSPSPRPLPWGEGESSAEPVDGRKGRGRKRMGVSRVPSPSPRPLPWGEGESFAAEWRIERDGSCGCPGLESPSAPRARRFSPACCPR